MGAFKCAHKEFKETETLTANFSLRGRITSLFSLTALTKKVCLLLCVSIWCLRWDKNYIYQRRERESSDMTVSETRKARLCWTYTVILYMKRLQNVFKSFRQKLEHAVHWLPGLLMHSLSIPERTNNQQSEGDKSSLLTYPVLICLCCKPFRKESPCGH